MTKFHEYYSIFSRKKLNPAINLELTSISGFSAFHGNTVSQRLKLGRTKKPSASSLPSHRKHCSRILLLSA